MISLLIVPFQLHGNVAASSAVSAFLVALDLRLHPAAA